MGARSDAEAEVADDPGDDVAEDAPDDAAAKGDDPAADLGDDEVIDAEVVDDDAAGTGAGDEAPLDADRTAQERDDYLGALRQVQADFENYRKRSLKQQTDAIDRATGQLVESLLPVLDACEGGIEHGDEGVTAVFTALLGTLERVGLERVDPAGEPFDPNAHEAVLHEPPGEDDGDATEPVVVEVMRPGYRWKERTLRAAMVKVKG